MAATERERLRAVLERARSGRVVMTYLQAADAAGIDPPHRIHRTTELLEELLEQDVRAGRPPLAALVVSKTRNGRPAPGFFDRAKQLGLDDGGEPDRFHRRLLSRLFDDQEPDS